MSQYQQKLKFTYSNGATYSVKHARLINWNTEAGIISYTTEEEDIAGGEYEGINYSHNVTTHSQYQVKDRDVLSLEVREANAVTILLNPKMPTSVRVDVKTPKQRCVEGTKRESKRVKAEVVEDIRISPENKAMNLAVGDVLIGQQTGGRYVVSGQTGRGDIRFHLQNGKAPIFTLPLAQLSENYKKVVLI